MLSTMGAQVKYSAPYLHQSNAAERVIRTLNSMLKSTTVSDGRQLQDWPDRLPAIAFSINTTISASTGQTPYKLFMGREPRLPIDFVFPPPGADNRPVEEVVRRQQADFLRTRDLVTDRQRQNRVRMEKMLSLIHI